MWSLVVCLVQIDLKKLSLIILFISIINQSIVLRLVALRAQRVKIRRWWVRSINKRKRQGFLCNLFCEFRLIDHEEFFAYTWLWLEQYKMLLELVTPYLRKRSNQNFLASWEISRNFDVNNYNYGSVWPRPDWPPATHST